MKAELKQLISKYKLEAFANKIENIVINAIAVSKLSSKPGRKKSLLGKSRMGGLPDVPPNFEWVTWQGRSLNFLAQFNCEELSKYDLDRVLPNVGMLYFFYDLDEQPWGFDPDDRGGAVVIYSPDSQSLIQASLPADIGEDFCLPSFNLSFKTTISIPSEDTLAFEQIGFSEEESESFNQLWQELSIADAGQELDPQPIHQLLGFSHNIQGDMQLECELVSNGISCGDAISAPKTQTLGKNAAEWRLLFQVDSDEDLGVMFGDCGMIYFWIRAFDLQEKRFDRAWTILQCC